MNASMVCACYCCLLLWPLALSCASGKAFSHGRMVIAALIPAAPLTLSLAPPIPTRCQERWGDAARKLADILNDDMFRSLEGKSKHQLWLELCDMITKHPKVRGCCCRACGQAGTHPQRTSLAASAQGRGSLVVQMKGPGDVV